MSLLNEAANVSRCRAAHHITVQHSRPPPPHTDTQDNRQRTGTSIATAGFQRRSGSSRVFPGIDRPGSPASPRALVVVVVAVVTMVVVIVSVTVVCVCLCVRA